MNVKARESSCSHGRSHPDKIRHTTEEKSSSSKGNPKGIGIKRVTETMEMR